MNTAPPVPIHKLDFKLDEEILQAIEKATVAYQKFAGKRARNNISRIALENRKKDKEKRKKTEKKEKK